MSDLGVVNAQLPAPLLGSTSARSSAGQSVGLRSQRPKVRILPCRLYGVVMVRNGFESR
jgi:hypothetical protein